MLIQLDSSSLPIMKLSITSEPGKTACPFRMDCQECAESAGCQDFVEDFDYFESWVDLNNNKSILDRNVLNITKL